MGEPSVHVERWVCSRPFTTTFEPGVQRLAAVEPFLYHQAEPKSRVVDKSETLERKASATLPGYLTILARHHDR